MNNAMQIHLACNDYRNGNPQHFIEAINIYSDDSFEPALMLTGCEVSCNIARSTGNKPRLLRLGHLRNIRLIGYVVWAGNWGWDAASVSTEDGIKIINYLMRRKWQCEEGWTDASLKWKNGESIVLADFGAIAS